MSVGDQCAVVSLVICNNMLSSDMCGKPKEMSTSNWKPHLFGEKKALHSTANWLWNIMLLCNVNEKSCKLGFHPCLDIEQVRLGLKTTSGAAGMFTEGLLLLLRLLPSKWVGRLPVCKWGAADKWVSTYQSIETLRSRLLQSTNRPKSGLCLLSRVSPEDCGGTIHNGKAARFWLERGFSSSYCEF